MASLPRTMRLLSARALRLPLHPRPSPLPVRPLSTTPRLALPPPAPIPIPTTSTAPPPLAAPDHLNAAEAEIFALLAAQLAPTALEVADVSGGCGSMYALSITAEAFRGLSVVKQHRLVNQCLKGKVETWHGLQVRCAVP